MIVLRPYQTDAIERVRACLQDGKRRVMLCAPTGSGKTVIASHVIASALDRGSRVLMVAHRRELVRQPFAKLLRYGINPDGVGVIMAGVKPPTGGTLGPVEAGASDSVLWAAYARQRPPAPIQIASIDTLRNRQKPPADLIIIDEAHRSLAKSYTTLLEHYPEAVVLGLTATPSRGDRRGLSEVYEELVVVASYRELAEQGYLVEPRVWTVERLPDLEGIKSKGGDYDLEQLAERCDRDELVGDLVEHYAQHGGGAPALAFATSVAHSKRIAARFAAAGYRAAHVDGTTPVEERDRIFEALSTGELQVVSNCDVASEGMDIPAVKCVISARPTKSLRVFLQQAGRGSRPHNGHEFVVLDHAGNAVAHGLPQDDREWSLEGRKARPGGGAPPCWTCEVCFAVNPLSALVCPECGAERPERVRREIAERAGRLVELRPLTEDERQCCWGYIVEEWKQRNADRDIPLKPGWCFYRFRERFKCAPPSGGERPEWTDDEARRRRRAEELQETAEQRGYAPGWIHVQLSQKKEEGRGGGPRNAPAEPDPGAPPFFHEERVQWAV